MSFFKKKKPVEEEVEDLVISAPTGFQRGVHVVAVEAPGQPVGSSRSYCANTVVCWAQEAGWCP